MKTYKGYVYETTKLYDGTYGYAVGVAVRELTREVLETAAEVFKVHKAAGLRTKKLAEAAAKKTIDSLETIEDIINKAIWTKEPKEVGGLSSLLED
tara:strand:+ start:645 stop:932 length:288 start_codon:yes stop_codon:yes gene_type:complete